MPPPSTTPSGRSSNSASTSTKKRRTTASDQPQNSPNLGFTDQPSDSATKNPLQRSRGSGSYPVDPPPTKRSRLDNDNTDAMVADAKNLLTWLESAMKKEYIVADEEYDTLRLALSAIIKMRYLGNDERTLLRYKITLAEGGTEDSEFKQRRLAYTNTLSKMFESFLKDHGSETEVEPLQAHTQMRDLVERRKTLLRQAAKAPAPSDAAKASTFVKAQRERPILMGRSLDTVGPPISIYHDVFARFKALVSDPNFKPDHEQRQPRTPQSLGAAAERTLGSVEGASTYARWEADGVILARTDYHVIPVGLMELENEVGAGGCDPSHQCIYSYQKEWCASELKGIRDACCCPCFLFTICGRLIGVYGAVLADDWIVQRLSELIDYGGSTDLDEEFDRATKILAALKICVADLKTFYEKLPPSSVPNASSFSPSFQTYNDDGEFRLTYTSGNLLPGRGDRAMFDALLHIPQEKERVKVKVKFTRRYSELAHKLLEKESLAPRLRHCTTVNGWTVVVMDVVGGEDLASLGKTTISPSTRMAKDINKAIETLHSNNLVFGDLRPPNVMACTREGEGGETEEGAMLVDFDLAGKAGETLYPKTLNPDVEWAEGAEAGMLITKDHDNQMYALLTGTSRVARSP
ncbi:hypothetical protein FS837_005615 [Tulasnella sp. UAMH 9824]|nr:hypothetical protein FS837_005615 [Tulasnella sp. UAMH 9824]